MKRRPFAVVVATAWLAACGGGGASPDSPPARWASLGELPAPEALPVNHTPLVVSGDALYVGTADGVWRRALADGDVWSRAGLAGFRVYALRASPAGGTTLLAGGAPALPSGPTFYRSDDLGQHWTAAQSWYRPPTSGGVAPIYDLAILPADPRVLFAAIDGSLAASSDGGMTWALTNGQTEASIGSPCVLAFSTGHPAYLVVGCEQPLDFAYLGSATVDPADPLAPGQPGPWYLGTDVLSNRRPNALELPPAEPGTVYAGVEGALLAVTAAGGEWIFSGGEPQSPWPYAYVTAIWVDPADRDHLIFGGKPNAVDSRLSLFETRDRGATLERVAPPRPFTDPAVVQLAADGANGLVVLISDGDGSGTTARRLYAYRLATG